MDRLLHCGRQGSRVEPDDRLQRRQRRGQFRHIACQRDAAVEGPRLRMREQQPRREWREAIEQRLDTHLGRRGRQGRTQRRDGKGGNHRPVIVAHDADHPVSLAQPERRQRLRQSRHPFAQFASGPTYPPSICVTGGERGCVGRRDRQIQQVVGIVQLQLREEARMFAVVADANWVRRCRTSGWVHASSPGSSARTFCIPVPRNLAVTGSRRIPGRCTSRVRW